MNPVDNYISSFPEPVRERLRSIRGLILEKAPDAEEKISYGMPAYRLNKRPLLYFSAFKKHIGLYATPTAQITFKKELSGYKHGKGSIQFPLDKEFPLELIGKIIEFRIAENRKSGD